MVETVDFTLPTVSDHSYQHLIKALCFYYSLGHLLKLHYFECFSLLLYVLHLSLNEFIASSP